MECQDYKYNWLKYIAVAYVLLTVFYILIVALRISVTSPALVAYVTVSQIFAAPGVMRFIYTSHGSIHKSLVLKVFSSLYAIWNLDFFRGVYKPFCLHPDLSMLQVICLDYIVGVYPLVLIFITYCLVRLHDRYVVISKLWKPFFNLFSFLRREWNIRESLVNAFAAFIVLSYVKMMNISFDLLTPSHSHRDPTGNFSNIPYLFINGSLPYFDQDHIPYAICTIFMLLIFNVFPLVLVSLYPCACFQKCLNLTKCSCQSLHIFMDALLGCYKVRPLDCRYFAGFYIFLRCINLLIFSFTKNVQYYLYSVYALVLTIVLVAVFKPYKNTIFSLSILLYTAMGHFF